MESLKSVISTDLRLRCSSGRRPHQLLDLELIAIGKIDIAALGGADDAVPVVELVHVRMGEDLSRDVGVGRLGDHADATHELAIEDLPEIAVGDLRGERDAVGQKRMPQFDRRMGKTAPVRRASASR